jgi:hypothetical protein
LATHLHPEAGDAQLLDYRVWQAPHIRRLLYFYLFFYFLFLFLIEWSQLTLVLHN